MLMAHCDDGYHWEAWVDLTLYAVFAIACVRLTGSSWGDWALYTALSVRAFKNELEVQAPFG